MNSRYSSYPGDVVKVVITRDQSVLQIKLASLLERRLILLLELGDIRGEVDVVEFYPLQTHRPVHIRQFPGHPGEIMDRVLGYIQDTFNKINNTK